MGGASSQLPSPASPPSRWVTSGDVAPPLCVTIRYSQCRPQVSDRARGAQGSSRPLSRKSTPSVEGVDLDRALPGEAAPRGCQCVLRTSPACCCAATGATPANLSHVAVGALALLSNQVVPLIGVTLRAVGLGGLVRALTSNPCRRDVSFSPPIFVSIGVAPLATLC
jgi:hypothetical protein